MNMFKKLFALVLALTLLLSLAVPAMANEHSHTITIKETAANHQYAAYQIFAGHVFSGADDGDDDTLATDQVLKNITWGSSVNYNLPYDWGTGIGSLYLVEALQNEKLNPDYNSYFGGIPPVLDPSKVDYDTDEEIATAVADALALKKEAANANAFARIVSKYLKTDPVASSAVPTDTNPYYTISNLSDGYYLVKDVNAVEGETMTDYIMHLVADVSVDPKDGNVGVTKYIMEGGNPVKVCSNAMGEKILIRIEGTLPSNLPEFKTFSYTFVDTMASGFEYVSGSAKLYTVNSDSVKEIVNPEGNPYFTVIPNPTGHTSYNDSSKQASLAVEFSDLKKLTTSDEYTVRSTSKIRLEYEVKLANATAAIGSNGNENEVYIKYSNNPYDLTTINKTARSLVHVFTFQLDVLKKDGVKNTNLKDVGFQLYRERGGKKQYAVVTKVQNETGASTIITEEGKPQIERIHKGAIIGWTNWSTEAELNKYVETTYSADEWNAKKAELLANPGIATTMWTDSNGTFNIRGLDLDDNYWLDETVKPQNYDDMDPVKLNLTAGYVEAENAVTNLKITIDNVPADGDNRTGKVSTTVVNNPGNTLPSTGGMGTTVFYIVGAVLVLGAMVLLVTKKRMEN